MATEISTHIRIEATPSQVWQVLTDFNNYPEWNPFVRSLTGQPKVGEQIQVELQPPGGKAMTFRPRVLAFNQNKEFRWIGHLGFKGVFDGEHIFELHDNGDGSTTFVQRERFKGILVPFLKKMLNGSTRQGFIQLNEALRSRVLA